MARACKMAPARSRCRVASGAGRERGGRPMTTLAEIEGTAAGSCPPEPVSGGEAVYWALRALGVECVFGISSIHNLPIFEAIDRLGGIAPVSSRHEQGATYAADGYARSTGKLGVVIASTG